MNLSGEGEHKHLVYSSKLLTKLSNPLLTLNQHNVSNQNSKILPKIRKVSLKKSLNSEYNIIWGENVKERKISGNKRS